MPIETVSGQSYSGQAVDVFSLGVIAFILLSGGPPFRMPKYDDQHYKNIVLGNYAAFWKLHDHFQFPAKFKDLMIQIFSDVPGLRPSISEIKHHPWMQEEMATKEEVIEEMEYRASLIA